ncbi:hypothetical protein, partial [Pseudomonas sp. SBT1-2]|uniref:hypothetical protein n=1 Tax=Pseudomonas sp. SBT1-2 TaxID=3027852 RepID=UPI0023609305
MLAIAAKRRSISHTASSLRFFASKLAPTENCGHKKGSSRITGKDALDLHEKEFAIPVTVRHS